jgi:hypothetical protein
MTQESRILYCHCTYAQVVPKEVKEQVLKRLCESGVAFDAVADLCEMSARRDPALARFASEGTVKIAACFPRAVKWLFSAAHASLPVQTTEVLNMRVQSADEVVAALLKKEVRPNLPVKDGAISNAAPVTTAEGAPGTRSSENASPIQNPA